MNFHLRVAVVLGSLLLLAAAAVAQGSAATTKAGAQEVTTSSKRAIDGTPSNVLTTGQWRRVDAAVGRAVNWLANRQESDGSFPTLDSGQPAVSSLCMMA